MAKKQSKKTVAKSVFEKSLWTAKAQDRFSQGIDKLPTELRAIAESLRDCNPDERIKIIEQWSGPSSKRQVLLDFWSLAEQEQARIFEAYFGPLTPHVAKAWSFVGTLRVSTGSHAFFQYPVNHARTLVAQTTWLLDLISAIAKVKPEVLTPEWLALWGARLDDSTVASLYAMLGFEQWEQSAQSAIGKLLASVLSSQSKSTDNVLDTLRLLAEGRHPAGEFGTQVPMALLLSSNLAARDCVLGLLASSDDAGFLGTIVAAATLAPAHTLAQVLEVVVQRQLWKLPTVQSSLARWLGLDTEVIAKTGDDFGEAVEWLTTVVGDERKRALEWSSGQTEYFLWLLYVEGMIDVNSLMGKAYELLKSNQSDARLAAARVLAQLGNPDAQTAWPMIMADPELSVALWALDWPGADVVSRDAEVNRKIRDQLTVYANRLKSSKVEIKKLARDFDVDSTLEDVLNVQAAYMLDGPVEDLFPHCTSHNGNLVLEYLISQLPIDSVEQRQVVFDLIDKVTDATERASRRKSPTSCFDECLRREKSDIVETVEELVVRRVTQATLQEQEFSRFENLWLRSEHSSIHEVLVQSVLASSDDLLLPMVSWLMSARKQALRLCGQKLLQHMVDSKRKLTWVKAQIHQYQARFPIPTTAENYSIRKLLADTKDIPLEAADTGSAKAAASSGSPPNAPQPTGNSALAGRIARTGALDARPKLWPQPEPIQVSLASSGASNLIDYLAKLDKENLSEEQVSDAIEKRPKSCRDQDGAELTRVYLNWLYRSSDSFVDWLKRSASRKTWLSLVKPFKTIKHYKSKGVAGYVERLFWRLNAVEFGFFLDYATAILASIPQSDIDNISKDDWRGHRDNSSVSQMITLILSHYEDSVLSPGGKEWAAIVQRFWPLACWYYQPTAQAKRMAMPDHLRWALVRAGLASELDVYQLVDTTHPTLSAFEVPYQLRECDSKLVKDYLTAAQKYIDDLIADELSRTSDAIGVHTEKVFRIDSVVGLLYLIATLEAFAGLSKANKKAPAWFFAKEDNRTQNQLSRAGVRTRLASVIYPRTSIDRSQANGGAQVPVTKESGLIKPSKAELEEFASGVGALRKSGAMSDSSLVELACLAPQWAWHVEYLLGWEGIAEAAYWFQVCTELLLKDNLLHCDGYIDWATAAVDAGLSKGPRRDTNSTDAAELRSLTIEALANDRVIQAFCGRATEITEDEYGFLEVTLAEAHKIAWGKAIRAKLGPDRWQLFADIARFRANSKSFSKLMDGLSGKAVVEKLPTIEKVIDDIESKHRKAALEFIGRIPLAKGKERDKDLGRRLAALSSYRRFYAPKVGGMFGEEAQRAVELADEALSSLATLAGCADYRLLYWRVGNSLSESLKEHGVFAVRDFKVQLELDASGAPVLLIEEKGKRLKSIPAKHKSNPKLKPLLTLRDECKMLFAASRDFLESAMILGLTFTTDELSSYKKNPIVSRLLLHTVMVVEPKVAKSKKMKPILGLMQFGKSPCLLDCDGSKLTLAPDTDLRVAHPVDFYATGKWLTWKCYMVEEQHPESFPQVHRQLFEPNADELARIALDVTDPFDISDSQKLDRVGSELGMVRLADYSGREDQFIAILSKHGWKKLWGDYYETRFGGYCAIARLDHSSKGATCQWVLFFALSGDDGLDYQLLSIADVPPRVFSEVLRQINVAVLGSKSEKVIQANDEQVPEIREDVIALRLQLLHELAAERKLKNLTIEGTTVSIKGKLDEYSLDLVSGQVSRKSKRLFSVNQKLVPPADNRFLEIDKQLPGTTFAVSLAILLAEDHKIREPSLIDQLRART